jgi:hypothetical protein
METTIRTVRVNDHVNPKFVSVTPVWSNVDRPDSASWMVPKALLPRFIAAVKAGMVFTSPKVEKDMNGRTFVHHKCNVLMRHLSADLKKLGF